MMIGISSTGTPASHQAARRQAVGDADGAEGFGAALDAARSGEARAGRDGVPPREDTSGERTSGEPVPAVVGEDGRIPEAHRAAGLLLAWTCAAAPAEPMASSSDTGGDPADPLVDGEGTADAGLLVPAADAEDAREGVHRSGATVQGSISMAPAGQRSGSRQEAAAHTMVDGGDHGDAAPAGLPSDGPLGGDTTDTAAPSSSDTDAVPGQDVTGRLLGRPTDRLATGAGESTVDGVGDQPGDSARGLRGTGPFAGSPSGATPDGRASSSPLKPSTSVHRPEFEPATDLDRVAPALSESSSPELLARIQDQVDGAARAPVRGGHDVITGSPLAPLEPAKVTATPAVEPVSQPPPSPDAHGAVLDQIVRSLRMHWTRGASEARIQLRPEHLGAVHVVLRVEAGAVTAVVRAESPQVQEWVLSHHQSLRQQLEAAGLRLDDLTVEPDAERRHQQTPPERRESRPRRRADGSVPQFQLIG